MGQSALTREASTGGPLPGPPGPRRVTGETDLRRHRGARHGEYRWPPEPGGGAGYGSAVIPLIPYGKKHYLFSPICNKGTQLNAAGVAGVARAQQLMGRYRSGLIMRKQYVSELDSRRDSSAALPFATPDRSVPESRFDGVFDASPGLSPAGP